MIRAAAYLRRSTTKQEMSLEGQREAVQGYAAKSGYSILREYVDDGISGATGAARPEFQRMIADARNGGGFKAVLAYDMSRFGRMDADETGHFRYLLREAGVRIVFTNENDGGEGEAGEMLRPMMAVQKREYLKQLSRDTLRGQVQAVKAGWVSGRAASFGYDRILVDDDGTTRARMKRGEKQTKPRGWHVGLAISDTVGEADALRWIFVAYTSREIGLAKLARELNDKGVKSPSGGKWCLATIREILQNPIYKGKLTFGRRAMGGFHRFTDGEVVKADQYGQKIEKRAEGEYLEYDKPELRLVSDELWNLANRLLKERGNGSRRAYNRTEDYPLSGLIVCGDCGKPLFGTKRDTHRVYCCTTYHRCRECHGNSVRSNPLLQVVRSVVARTLESGGMLDDLKAETLKVLRNRQRAGGTKENNAKELSEAKGAYERAIKNMLAADSEDLPTLRLHLRELRERVSALEASQTETATHTPESLVAAGFKNLKGLLDELPRAAGSRLKAVLRNLFERIELSFGWTAWGSRQIRCVTGGTLTFRTFNSDGRGEWI